MAPRPILDPDVQTAHPPPDGGPADRRGRRDFLAGAAATTLVYSLLAALSSRADASGLQPLLEFSAAQADRLPSWTHAAVFVLGGLAVTLAAILGFHAWRLQVLKIKVRIAVQRRRLAEEESKLPSRQEAESK